MFYAEIMWFFLSQERVTLYQKGELGDIMWADGISGTIYIEMDGNGVAGGFLDDGPTGVAVHQTALHVVSPMAFGDICILTRMKLQETQ